jgi:hypothetical protein
MVFQEPQVLNLPTSVQPLGEYRTQLEAVLLYRRRASLTGESPRRKEAVSNISPWLNINLRASVCGEGSSIGQKPVFLGSDSNPESARFDLASILIFPMKFSPAEPPAELPTIQNHERYVEVNIPSDSSQARPAPKPRPTHAGQALRLNSRTEKTTPKDRPRDDLIIMEEMARSHYRIVRLAHVSDSSRNHQNVN